MKINPDSTNVSPNSFEKVENTVTTEFTSTTSEKIDKLTKLVLGFTTNSPSLADRVQKQ